MYACADRYCVSGLTVAREGDVCQECAPDYAAASIADEDAVCVALAHQDRDTRGYFV